MASNSTQCSKNPSREVGIAGAGRVGRSLGKLLNERGQKVVAVASRNRARAKAAAAFIGREVQAVSYTDLPSKVDKILIAVSDDSIGQIANTLAEAGLTEGTVLHTSGIYGTDVLAPLIAQGNSCAGLHPLQTIATPQQGVQKLPSATFTIVGSGRAAEWAEKIVNLLHGKILRIAPGRKSTYHAAAVIASNYIVSLIDAAVLVMGAAGVDPEAARRALAPLVQASVQNALAERPVKALTGPIQRGDIQTLALHLQGLALVPASIQQLYRAVGIQTVQLARKQGLDSAVARQLEHLLRRSK
ncbi:DUF2520 domain-containing protein [Acidobacteria bacterium AH-259-O06]|nr:DUF2520 domain-containing protein [Acidobacteria bacterium AH-259-O06]